MDIVTRRTRNAVVLLVALLATLLSPAVQAAMPFLEGPGGVPTLAPLLDRVTPAVVNISVQSPAPAEENPLFRDPFFRRYFDLPEAPPAPPSLSAGSGVIVDAGKGYVITNHHVIENAEKIVVTLKDRRRFEATLVGSDPGTDIALLKIEPDNLTALPFGDSEALRVGDFVIAIGYPFGLGQTVTSGIVSALGRSGLNLEGYEDYIQTDAPINPGNSGGALITLTGELVGINTAIIAPAGGNVGIGFAVPTRNAKAIMTQLVAHGEVRRGRLGIIIQDLTPDIAEALGLEETQGAVVREVASGSSAEDAGIKAGDVIVAFNGRPLRSSSDLRNSVGLVPAGETVELTLVRKGKRETVRATLREPQAAAAPAEEKTERLVGATFQDIEPTPETGGRDGVLVAAVAPGSPAWQQGVREGDIILAVNREPVASVKELQAALDKAGRVAALQILRNGTEIFLFVR